MPKVYFSKQIQKIIDKLAFSKLGNKVAIKVHFGERGCKTYINPEIVRKVYNKVKSLGKQPSLVECNVLYRGSRTEKTEHIKTAKEHGFTDMEIDILDGTLGEEFVEIKGCKIGKSIEKYDSLIVLSHFKGHGMAGFGGAIKNIGMGLGSRGGKLDMHSKIKPSVCDSLCIGCGKCKEGCDFNAIDIINGKAHIDRKKCVGCAMCIGVCPQKAVKIPWHGGSSERLQEKTAQYAEAVLSLFKGKALFVNVLENITKECDCMGRKQKPVIDDIGILAGNDVVAVEKASLDLADKSGFEKVNSEIDKQHQISSAIDAGLGVGDYEVIKL
jgi:hypothetical protein